MTEKTPAKMRSSSVIVAKQADSESEYVSYVLKMTFVREFIANLFIANEDRSKYPIVTMDACVPSTATESANVTVRNAVYTFPKDFDFDYTFRSELNEETGCGYELIKSKLHFKNLPGRPTLIDLAEEKSSGVPTKDGDDVSHYEMFGNVQLTGTGIFKNVQGAGVATFGASTGFVVHHVAWIKRWPL